MGFTLSDAIILLVVMVVLVLYRQLDRNNRSVDKVRRYASRVQDELEEIAAEKVAVLRDIGIEVDVQQKAAKGILTRIQTIEQDLSSRVESLETIGTRLTEYESALKELVNMTGRTEDNIARVRQESEHVEKVGKRIKQSQAKMDELEASLPRIVAGFEKQNNSRISLVEERFFDEGERRMVVLTGRAEAAEARIVEFTDEVARLQAENDERANAQRRLLDDTYEQLSVRLTDASTEAIDELQRTIREELDRVAQETAAAGDRIEVVRQEIDQNVDVARGELQAVLVDYQNRIERVASEGRDLSADSLDAVRRLISDTAAELKQRAEQLFGQVSSALDERGDQLETQARESEERLRQRMDAVSNQAGEASRRILARLQNDTQGLADTVRSAIEGQYRDLASSFHSALQTAERERDQTNATLQQWRSATATRLAELTAEQELVGRRLDEAVTALTAQLADTEALATGRAAELRERVDAQLRETDSSVRAAAAEATRVATERRDQIETLIVDYRGRATEQLSEIESLVADRIADHRERTDVALTQAETTVENATAEAARVAAERRDQVEALIVDDRGRAAQQLSETETLVAARIAELRERVDAQLLETDSSVRTAAAEAERVALERRDQVETLLHEHRGVAEASLQRLRADQEAALQALRDASDRALAEASVATDQARSHTDTVRAEVERQTQALETAIVERLQALEHNAREGYDRAADLSSRAAVELTRVEERLDAGVQQLDARRISMERGVTDSLEAGIAQLTDRVAQTNADFSADAERRTTEVQHYLEAAQRKLDDRVHAMSEAMHARVGELEGEFTEKMQAAFHAGEQRVLGSVELRLSDTEQDLSYRIGRVEAVADEIDSLERTLSANVQAVTVRIREELTAAARRLHDESDRSANETRERYAEVKGRVDNLDQELSDLKQRAYDNVGATLKVFEDEFFDDLNKRVAEMTQRIESWREMVERDLAEIRERAAVDRRDVEAAYTSELRTTLQQHQEATGNQIYKLSDQVETFRNGILQRVETAEQAISAQEAAVGDQLQKASADVEAAVRGGLSDLRGALETEIGAVRVEAGEGVAALKVQVDDYRDAIAAQMEQSRELLARWQAELQNRMKAGDSEVGSQLADTRVRLSESVQDLKREFATERAELIEQSGAVRETARRRLDELTARVDTLSTDVHQRSESAIKEFEIQYAELARRQHERARELVQSMDRSSGDFRDLIGHTRDQFQAMQAKVLGKLDQEARSIGVTLQEIEKRQKSFSEQTKIFERADSLKIQLQTDIAALKAELSRSVGMRDEVREIEHQFNRIRKMAADSSEKMARFASDKRRIDLLEEDYHRLMQLAQVVEGKIELVGGSEERLHELTARVQSLGQLENEVDARYDRLEKRRQSIDQTTSVVERNSEAIRTVDRQLAQIEQRLVEMPKVANALGVRLESLLEHKQDTDAAVKLLAGLHEVLEDVERRTHELQTAREWLARTETRLQQIQEAAGDQVKLLATLMREQGDGRDDKSATPSLSTRETVQKLARQGWKADEIARATKVSRGEVELILELSGK